MKKKPSSIPNPPFNLLTNRLAIPHNLINQLVNLLPYSGRE